MALRTIEASASGGSASACTVKAAEKLRRSVDFVGAVGRSKAACCSVERAVMKQEQMVRDRLEVQVAVQVEMELDGDMEFIRVALT